MGTSYFEIYDRFLRKITDIKLAQVSESDMQLVLLGYMESAIAKFRKCKTDLSLRDNVLLAFDEELLDIEQEIIALQMVSEWISPQLNSVLLTKQFVGWKEEKFFAQANQIDKLLALKEKSEQESRKLRRDYVYMNNEYLNRT